MRFLEIIITFLFLTFYQNSFSQGQISKHSIYTNVLQNADPSHAKANIGYEVLLKDSLSFAFGAGICYSSVDDMSTSGIYLNSEFKRFIVNQNYWGIGISYGMMNYTRSHKFVPEIDTGYPSYQYEDTFKVEKFYIEVYAKYGIRQNLGKRFYVDMYGGAGFRVKITKHFDRINPEDRFEDRHPTFLAFRDVKGSFFYPIIKAGIILGFRW